MDFWREDDLLVVRKEAALPDRCIATGAPTGGNAVSRKVRFIPEWSLALFILVSPLFGLIAMLIAGKSRRMTYHIDPALQEKRRVAIRVGLGLFAASAGTFGIGAAYLLDGLLATAFVLFVAGLIVVDQVAIPFRVHRIKGDLIYLRVKPAYWAGA